MTHTTQVRLLRTSLSRFHDGHHPFLTSHPLWARATAIAIASSSWRLPARRQQVRLSSSSTSSPTSPLATKPSPTPPSLGVSPSAANPPETTRPPPLNLPERDPAKPYVSHLFATGKAYVTFYKTGLKYLYGNARLVYAQSSATSLPRDEPLSPADRARPSPHPVAGPAGSTRAHFLLRARTSHDMRRIPLFALLLLVCGEFTPLVALWLPRIVPLTCRVPAHEAAVQKEVEAQRAAARADLRRANAARGAASTEDPAPDQIDVHVARCLGLLSRWWRRVGLAPRFLARRRVARRLAFLARDDALLRQAGGEPALVAPEVVLACADRGLDVLGKSDADLRRLLALWLQLTKGPDDAETRRRIMTLLARRVEDWPAAWGPRR